MRRNVLGAGAAAIAAVGLAAFGAATLGAQSGDARSNAAKRRLRRKRKLTSAERARRRRVANSPSATNPPADRDAGYVGASGQGASPSGKLTSSAARAALAATGTSDSPENQAHLLSRATFGARASDTAAITATGIDGWLSAQLDPSNLADPDGEKAWAAFPLSRLSISGVRNLVKEFAWDAAQQTAQATLGAQVYSSRQLYEVVVDVFTNLLNVTTPSDSVWATGTDYAHSVIRPHAFGRYADMLQAAMRHPAMLTYLNNNESTKTNVNENLGRELLELHTIGVTSGYTETDVRNSANILSGRGINWKTSEFAYNESDHYIGAVATGWFSHPNATASGGLMVGDSYIGSLAVHPATAATVARKLAVRFISDNPPQSVIDRLASAYLANDTQIVPMLVVLFSSTEFWSAPRAKWRRPLEDAVGSARAIGVIPSTDLARGITDLFWVLQSMGQAPLSWIPPNGFPDVTAAWMSASQMVSRWNLHRGLADGWWKGLTPPRKLSDELAPGAGQTNAQWVDVIARRVIGRTLPANHTAVLLAYLGVEGSAIAHDYDAWKASSLAALILDSPNFQLR